MKCREGETNPKLSLLKYLPLTITVISCLPPWISHLFSQWSSSRDHSLFFEPFLQLGCILLEIFINESQSHNHYTFLGIFIVCSLLSLKPPKFRGLIITHLHTNFYLLPMSNLACGRDNKLVLFCE